MNNLSTYFLFFFLLVVGSSFVSGQAIKSNPLRYKRADITFIKNPEGKTIDSISIRTSMDELPYGFNFSNDSLLLDIRLLHPVDELTIETFTKGYSFGQHSCWVDAPTANVYLSIFKGSNKVDSVGLSPVDRFYQETKLFVNRQLTMQFQKNSLLDLLYDWEQDLMAVRFMEQFLDFPNVTRLDAQELLSLMNDGFEGLSPHPYYQEQKARAKALAQPKSWLLKKLSFKGVDGKLRNLPKPTSQIFLLEIYQRDSPESRVNHQILKKVPSLDSLLKKMPIISLTQDDSEALWRLYVKDENFKWRHGFVPFGVKGNDLEQWAIYPHTTYLLVDKKFRIVGIYPDLKKMAAKVWWHSQN